MCISTKIQKIITHLSQGGLVCFPTETIYALACSAQYTTSIKKIYEAKKRNTKKSFSILAESLDSVSELVNISESQYKIIKHFTPGPFTFVLQRKNELGTLGIRIPDHPIALQILRLFQGTLIATSPNISDTLTSCKKFQDIDKSILAYVSYQIEDDSLVQGTHSTVIDLSKYPQYSILREGIRFFEILEYLEDL